MPTRKPYAGTQRKLVIGIDVGTTFSGVSYSILDPGVVPVIQGVHRYPAQERVGGDAKIPSLLYYDRMGFVRAVGAEVLQENNIETAGDEGWVKVERFKLHLRPHHARRLVDEPPPLPANKTIVQVFGDFLRYLYNCSGTYFQETHEGGVQLWRSLEGHVDFVLTHPNDWEGPQRAQMRCAAIHGGLVPDNPDGHARVRFVTEGEASLHFCRRVDANWSADVIKSGEGIILVDAGNQVVHISAYYMNNATGTFEEIAPPTSCSQGFMAVTRRAQTFLENKLCNSRYGTPDDITHITNCFDKSTKLAFKDPARTCFIRFGSSRDSDDSVDIRLGQVKLPGTDVAKFFEPSITAVQEAIAEQVSRARVQVTSVVLIGKFAVSDWLFLRLKAHLQTTNMKLFRPDGHMDKAVADDAVACYHDHLISVRVARTTFGTECSVPFDRTNPAHLSRAHNMIYLPSGQRLPDAFNVILRRGTRVAETTVFQQQCFQESVSAASLTSISMDIIAYRGSDPNPEWLDAEPERFSVSCTVTAEALPARVLQQKYDQNGTKYYRMEYSVILSFGLMETKAQISWMDNGVEKRGPASIIYNLHAGRD